MVRSKCTFSVGQLDQMLRYLAIYLDNSLDDGQLQFVTASSVKKRFAVCRCMEDIDRIDLLLNDHFAFDCEIE
ncbi:unnamed protein product [Soboliphyme baturini]|uniref:Transposase n=1 Tax=Soboliphyme baturini TaxID=241478 RepID=A0A183IG64_9BILA|nr:unnamed protein product [Soboliphyme baturini]